MQNLEIKCRVVDVHALRRLVMAAGGSRIGELRQIDTYFRAGHGLLKLREIEGQPAELIAYERPESSGSRISDYQLYTTVDPAGLKEVLARSHDLLVTVRKVRELFLIEQTRVHLDSVEGLGSFVELETAGTNRGPNEVRAEHERIMEALELDRTRGIGLGYAAMLGASVPS